MLDSICKSEYLTDYDYKIVFLVIKLNITRLSVPSILNKSFSAGGDQMQAQTTATDLEAIQQRERDMAQMEVSIKNRYKI